MPGDEFKALLMGYLDEELTHEEVLRVENHLRECQGCSLELEDFRRLKGVTRDMRVLMPDDKYWEDYWSHIYNRLERRIGWILMSLGAILLTSYGLYEILEKFVLGPDIPWIIRIGIVAFVVGICALIVSVLRERLFFIKSDKYERVKR